MPDPQQPMTETQGMPQGTDPASMYRAWLTAQSQGGTQTGPSMTHTQAQQPVPRKDTRTDYGAQYGPQRASMKDFSNSVSNIIGQVGQTIQRRKATEQQHTFDRFTQSWKGFQQAQSEVQETQAALKQNPQDQEALQRFQRAQQAMNQNKMILDTMFNGPHGEKNYKMLSKGFGVDDKNAGTPERQAAMTAFKKLYPVGDRAAGILSQLPQTQQLSPEAQRQQMLQQSGVIGKPPSQDQILRSETAQRGQDIAATTQRMRIAAQQGMALDKIKMVGQLKGIQVLGKDENGNLITHVMDKEERAKYPYLKSQDDLAEAKTELDRAMTDAKNNPNSPEMRVKFMEAAARKEDADARMIAARAAEMRAMVAQAKEPPEVAQARKDADRLETEYAKAQEYVKTPTPTNDTALVFSFVRAQVAGAGRMTNTEIQQALRSGSFGTRLSNAYNRATKGELDPDLRQQYADTIKIAAEKARLTADKYDTHKSKESAAPSFDELQKQLEDLAH